jgi:hypothetical protein
MKSYFQTNLGRIDANNLSIGPDFVDTIKITAVNSLICPTMDIKAVIRTQRIDSVIIREYIKPSLS